MLFLLSLLTVPFNGIVVRYRAGCHPTISVDDGSLPPAPTFFGVAKRVWRLQGVEGLTKGLMPTVTAAFFLFLFFPSSVPKVYFSPSPMDSRWLISRLFSVLFYTVPMVAVYRAIVTPRKLDALNAREALHILFSVHERKKPWAIFQIPGLLPAILAILMLHEFVLDPLQANIQPLYSHFGTTEHAVRQGILVLLALLATIVIAPLEVIVTRLALQRNYGGPSFDAELDVESALAPAAVQSITLAPPTMAPVEPDREAPSAKDADQLSDKAAYPVDKPADLTAAEIGPITVVPTEDDVVVHLRSENAPYLGLLDCGKKIIAEEGWPVLYRMWFLTFLGIFI